MAFALFDAWQFMAGVLPATLRALLRNVQIRSRRICPTQESVPDKQQIKQKAQSFD